MKAQMKKHVTPKWVDRLLIGVLLAMPVLYIAGFNFNYGPSMSHLGWFYRTSWGEQPTRVGQIVRFAPPNQPAWRKYILPMVKRVAEIRSDGYFVEGDNTEHSQDSRDWNKDVPPDHVAGVVVWCWSPARAWRGRTAVGKLRNWVEFVFGPNRTKWNPKHDDVWALMLDDHTMTVRRQYAQIFGPRRFKENLIGCQDFWNPDGTVSYTCYNQFGFPSLRQWSLETGEITVRDYKPTIVERVMPDGSRLRSLCTEPNQDPQLAFSDIGWGPVMPSSNEGHFNYLDLIYPDNRVVREVSATWTGGESLQIYTSSDGEHWKSVHLFNPPPPNGNIRSVDFEKPISSKYWRFELVNDKSSIAGGMKLWKLQIR